MQNENDYCILQGCVTFIWEFIWYRMFRPFWWFLAPDLVQSLFYCFWAQTLTNFGDFWRQIWCRAFFTISGPINCQIWAISGDWNGLFLAISGCWICPFIRIYNIRNPEIAKKVSGISMIYLHLFNQINLPNMVSFQSLCNTFVYAFKFHPPTNL